LKNKSLKIGILGLGRLGSSLGKLIQSSGHEVSVFVDDAISERVVDECRKHNYTMISIGDPKPKLDALVVAINLPTMRGTFSDALSLATDTIKNEGHVFSAVPLGEYQHLAQKPKSLIRISCSSAIAHNPSQAQAYVSSSASKSALKVLNNLTPETSWKVIPYREFDEREGCFAVAGLICNLMFQYYSGAPDEVRRNPDWLLEPIKEAELLLAAHKLDAWRAYESTATPLGWVRGLVDKFIKEDRQ